METMPHLRLHDAPAAENYTSTATGSERQFDLPPRDPSTHAPKLRSDISQAVSEAARRRAAEIYDPTGAVERRDDGLVLTFESDPGHELKLESLESQAQGIVLVSVCTVDGVQRAKVFVPEGKQRHFLKRLDDYAAKARLTFACPSGARQQVEALADESQSISVSLRERRNGGLNATIRCPVADTGRLCAAVSAVASNLKEVRENQPLVGSVSAIRLALVGDFWQDLGTQPPPPSTPIWWEVWLRLGDRTEAPATVERFRALAERQGLRVGTRHVAFPECAVTVTFGTATQLAGSFALLAMLSELRRAKELATPYLNLRPAEQRPFADDLLRRLQPPEANAPAVCILDGGVNRGHPLLQSLLAATDMFAVVAEWGTADHNEYQHGTGMAGIALYGCLTSMLASAGPVRVRHRLESVKILPPPDQDPNAPDVYGAITQQAASLAEIRSPARNRVLCMAITAPDTDQGLPSSWSAAVDELCAGVLDEAPKLMFVSAGNVRQELHAPEYRYHEWNCSRAGVEDPAQSWNAVTVGAYTDKVQIEEADFDGWQPIASAGELCPTSRTSLAWPEQHHKGWPTKPDFVCEGGNYAEMGGHRSATDDLSLLTTIVHRSGRLFEPTRDTSPATAEAARLAATLWSYYPALRPETIRGLLVHSARWTPAMLRRFPVDGKAGVQKLLRCYGYGVPDLERARRSVSNNVTMVFEGELQPFRLDGSAPKTNHMHVHSLPWPREALQQLGEVPVTMRVTLSYFVEPSPGRVGWGRNHRYQSHGLRFDLIRPNESPVEFRRRISRTNWDDPSDPSTRPDAVRETRNWMVGDQGRTRGSIHSDWWSGTAAELAASHQLAIFPVTGWWRERKHLNKVESICRYSLVVSIETPRTNVDLYGLVSVATEVATEVFT